MLHDTAFDVCRALATLGIFICQVSKRDIWHTGFRPLTTRPCDWSCVAYSGKSCYSSCQIRQLCACTFPLRHARCGPPPGPVSVSLSAFLVLISYHWDVVVSLSCCCVMCLYVHIGMHLPARCDLTVFAHMTSILHLLQRWQLKQSYASRYVSLCNRRGISTTMLIPADLKDAYFLPRINASTSRAGPGDLRDKRAVFLGSPTGWENGRRQALCKAGALPPDNM